MFELSFNLSVRSAYKQHALVFLCWLANLSWHGRYPDEKNVKTEAINESNSLTLLIE